VGGIGAERGDGARRRRALVQKTRRTLTMADRRQLWKFTAVFASGTMLSRITGLARDIIIGYVMPRGSLDAFLVGFRFPNMLRDIVGEGASNAAFVPVLTETLEKKGHEAFRELTSALMSAMIIVLGVISVLGVIFMPYIYGLTNPLQHFTGETLSPQQDQLMRSLTRWMFPYIFFIGLTVFQMGPLFIMKHYSTPSWSPALLNLFLILTCWKVFGNLFPDPAYGLVVGVWLGGIAQFIVQYIALGRRAQTWIPNFRLRHPGIKTAIWLWLPVVIGQSAGEVNKLVDTLFAVSMAEGTVTALSYANRIVQLPLSVFGIAISAAILPAVSRAAARGEYDDIRETLTYGFRQTYFLIFPTLMLLIVMPRPIVSLLFEHGRFGASVADRTAVALALYAAGLLVFAWVKVAVAGFYAIQNTRTPVIAAFSSMVLNIVLIFILAPSMGYKGLALATTLSYTVNFGLLYLLLWKRYGSLLSVPFAVSLLKTTIASVVMALAAYATVSALPRYVPGHSLSSRMIMVAVPMAVAGAVYLAMCAALKVPELKTLLSILNRKAGNTQSDEPPPSIAP
jgi:putative peptidoglycan lipid II flippase